MTDGQPRFVWVDGAVRPADAEHLSVFDRGFQLGDGVFETLRARAGRVTELPEHVARLRRSAEGLGIEVPEDVGEVLAAGVAELLAAEGLDVPDGDASIRVTVSRGRWFARGLLPPPAERLVATVAIQAWPVARHTSTEPRGGCPSWPRRSAATRQPVAGAEDHLARRLRLRQARGAACRGRRRGVPHRGGPPVRGDDGEPLPRPGGPRWRDRAGDPVARLRDPLRDDARLAGGVGRAGGAAAGRGAPRAAGARGRVEAFISSSVAGVVPVVAFDGGRIGDGMPGPWTLRARTDREAFVVDGRSPASRD